MKSAQKRNARLLGANLVGDAKEGTDVRAEIDGQVFAVEELGDVVVISGGDEHGGSGRSAPHLRVVAVDEGLRRHDF